MDQKTKSSETRKQQTITSNYLFQLIMRKKWREVVQVYENHTWAHTASLTKSKETALHVAVSSYNAQSKSCIADCIVQMISSIPEDNVFDILSLRNDKENTPLHLAAAVGWEDICEFIASKHPDLITIRNAEDETPLFMAANHGNLGAFLCLHEVYKKKKAEQESDHCSLLRSKDGNTILHSAILGENFRLAYQIICYYPKLVCSVNEKGESPLHVLAKKPNAFKNSSELGLFDSIIYHCIFVDELKVHKYVLGACKNRFSPRGGINYPENYRSCANLLRLCWFTISKIIIGGPEVYNRHNKQTGSSTDEENQQRNESQAKHSEEEHGDVGFYPANCVTCILLFKFAMNVILAVLGFGIFRIRKIQYKRKRCSHAIQIMNKMIEYESCFEYSSDGKKPAQELDPQYSGQVMLPTTSLRADCHRSIESKDGETSNETQHKNEKEKDQTKSVTKDTPLLIAVKMGILEMVEKILCTFPLAIQDMDSNGKNVLLLAAENRQPSVFDYLMSLKLPNYMFHHLDDKGNNILHLAAKLGELQPWRIPGATLQMQWELKWYEYVKDYVPGICVSQRNKEGKTPWKIFSTTHKKLVKESAEWLIKTSESCSVIAALVASVSFATFASVPGGISEETGYPIMLPRIEFDIFSLTSLIALCLSVAALLFFLAIITSREQRIKSTLARKLLMGLTSLFASIAAMFASFCAGHSFILGEKLRRAAFTIYGISWIAVTFFGVAHLPLLFDLLWAEVWQGRKVPLGRKSVYY